MTEAASRADASVRAFLAARPKTVPDKFRAMKRNVEPIDPIWVLLVLLSTILIGVLLVLRRRRKDTKIDRLVLTARVQERGFSAEEQELMHEIADLRRRWDASELVPRLRAYDTALEAYLGRGTPRNPDEREALVHHLAEIRTKLGFERLPEHRHLPSTREIPHGTALSVRRDRGASESFHPAIAHQVDDLDLRIRFLSGGDSLAVPVPPPDFAVRERLEVVFAHGPRRRCRFLTVVLGDPEGDGTVLPLSHAEVTTLTLERNQRADLGLAARLRTEDGEETAVLIDELTPREAVLMEALPAAAREGVLVVAFPGVDDPVEIAVTASSDDEALGRRLQLHELEEDARQSLLHFLAAAPAAV